MLFWRILAMMEIRINSNENNSAECPLEFCKTTGKGTPQSNSYDGLE